MPYHQLYHFYCCYHCGEWCYSNKAIKVKKCWKCAKTFQYKNSTKFTKKCTPQEAINVIKSLKEKAGKIDFNNITEIAPNIYSSFKSKK